MDFPTAPSGPPGRGPPNRNAGGAPPPPPTQPPPRRGDPSKRRREGLKKHESPPIVLSNLCPIEKYYAAADNVLDRFRECLAASDLDDAYVVGLRFALFSTASLPNHDYYASPDPRLAKRRTKNRADAAWVTRGLERIVEVMDREEIKKRAEDEQKKREAMKLWERGARERLQRPPEPVGRQSSGSGLDMSSRLARLNAQFPRSDSNDDDHDNVQGAETNSLASLGPLPPPLPPPLSSSSDELLALQSLALGPEQLKSNGATPMFPEPPSYSDLFLDSLRASSGSLSASTVPSVFNDSGGPMAPSAPPLSPAQSSPGRPKPIPQPPVRALQRTYSLELDRMRRDGRLEARRLRTHQGRLHAPNDSTNGCTVISPLVVAAHVRGGGNGVSDTAIEDVIDRRAPPILRTVRTKLGLNQHALIIPSDVHDYLVDERILPQDSFVGVCGGNVLDEGHTSELMNMLVKGKDRGSPNRKTAAALFFREHVVSIVKTPLPSGACWFDLVDSLPSVDGMASRTRCKDRTAFELLLKHYACHKFSEANCNFIEGHEWDDVMCDFDPRVFQAFVWSE